MPKMSINPENAQIEIGLQNAYNLHHIASREKFSILVVKLCRKSYRFCKYLVISTLLPVQEALLIITELSVGELLGINSGESLTDS